MTFLQNDRVTRECTYIVIHEIVFIFLERSEREVDFAGMCF